MRGQILGMRYQPPCRGCKDRSITCHGKCKKYNEYRKAEAAFRKEQYRKERDAKEAGWKDW